MTKLLWLWRHLPRRYIMAAMTAAVAAVPAAASPEAYEEAAAIAQGRRGPTTSCVEEKKWAERTAASPERAPNL